MFPKNQQTTQAKIPDIVVEAEIIEDDKSLKGAPKAAAVAHRAANVLDSLADTVQAVSPETAAQMRDRASVVRGVGRSVEAISSEGKALVDEGKRLGQSVKETLAKIGIEPHLAKRSRGGRR